jgi:hypothetical protein
MKDKLEEKKNKKPSRKDEPLVIPLDFEETLEALLQAKPPEKKKPIKKEKPEKKDYADKI